MNRNEANALLSVELEALRGRPYSELVEMIRQEPLTFERTGPAGARYQIEIQVMWDDRSVGNVRVIGLVDDGGLRAIVPISGDFIKSPAGTFIGE